MARVQFPIGIKIFGVATSMLALLLGVASLNFVRIRRVNGELIDIAEYLTPITELVAEVNIHALEQEIHFERVLKFYEIDPVPQGQIATELEIFEERGAQVDEELETAIALAEVASKEAHTTKDAVEFARLIPLLEVLEEEHQRFHDHGHEILALLEAGNRRDAELLDAQLATYEDDFNQRLQALLFELGQFTEEAAAIAEKDEQLTLTLNWILLGSAVGVGLVFAFGVTTSLVRPIRRLVISTQAVEQGDLDMQLPVDSGDEIGKLTGFFNRMVASIREKERLKTTFGQYVDPRIVETLVAHQGDIGGSQTVQATVFFSDIVGFSGISELLTPTGLVSLINQYLTLASAPIKARGGVINQFIGDAVSAFWGPPFVDAADQARLACYAALEQQDQLVKLRRSLPEVIGIRKGLPEVRIRVGLATGDVVTGNIGSEQSKSYTVMGPAMQWAEALEEANRIYGTTILLTATTRELAGDDFITREVTELALADQPTPVYELLGTIGTLGEQGQTLCDQFEQGLVAFRAQDWAQARDRFQSCLELQPEDGPSQYYLAQLPDLVAV
ncbi:MAG: adenylate/guanylate cyclase domain-containing protein [Leptolyngbyaceae cyanobacterium]